ncbi:hypothetical protein [Streptomyces sp. NPDC050355]|uniref:hypothetical protein n=1 Tax=Streptomyces sp. NPDC050355 TaxID=3365609 RepID=UPI0037903541
MTDATYPELLQSLEEFIESTNTGSTNPHHARHITGLYHLLAPLLSHIEHADLEFTDEPVLSNPEAVRGLRRAAAGETVDADAIHEHLTALGLAYSEDQDPDFHVISQSAYAAAAWLSLLAGRKLRTDDHLDDGEDVLPRFAPSTFTQIIDLLAWTRSDQVYVIWEDAATDPDLGDLSAATRELGAMHMEFTA